MAFSHTLADRLSAALEQAEREGTSREEIVLQSPQGPWVETADGEMLNFCSNDYLGLSHHPEVVQAAQRAIDTRGTGLASARFICGTQDIHQLLEAEIADFVQSEAALLTNSCFDANLGVFQALLGPEDAIFSDELNHASIIDGVRLCRAQKYRYKHSDLTDLAAKLAEAKDAQVRLIVTDGVFSMDGELAKLPEILELAREHDALVLVDDSHGMGVLGENGRGVGELQGVQEDIDLFTGTFGKAVGGAAGGFISGSKLIIDYLKKQARPYLFSNAVAPAVVETSRASLKVLREQPQLLTKLRENTTILRHELTNLGYTLQPGVHPIIPVMIGDEVATQRIAAALRAAGMLVVGFTFPVVPRGTGRVRVQVSAAHTEDDIVRAVRIFEDVRPLLESAG